jgi:D-alanine-D-alanine ligase
MTVVVLCGGSGAEREVSLKSGRAMAEALGSVIGPEAVQLVDTPASSRLPPAVLRAEVALLAMHGVWGEDGTLQTLLEEAGVPYLGSDPAVSRLVFDKEATKSRLREAGIPTPDSLVVEPDSDLHPAAVIEELGLPLFVKPVAEGSSIGVQRVETPEQLIDTVCGLLAGGARVLVEQPVLGGEYTVALVDGEPLPVVQIVTPRPFFDYVAKYEDEATRYYLEHDLSPEALAEVTRLGVEAYRVLGCRHLARVDVMHDGASAWVLEANTLPGMTERSLLPMAARAAGMSFGDLCAYLVQLVKRDVRSQGVA